MDNVKILFNAPKVAYRELYDVGVASINSEVVEFENTALDIIHQIKRHPIIVSALIKTLAEIYDESKTTIAEDVKQFLFGLAEKEIILTTPDIRQFIDKDCLSYKLPSLQEHNTKAKCWQIARENQIPFKCKFNITFRCNQACCFCYNGDRSRNKLPYPKSSELKLSEIESLFKELYEAGNYFLTFTGGEPFARKDFDDIFIVI